MDEKDRKELNLLTIDERNTKLEAKNEAEIQQLVEAYLVQLGYERRTPKDIERGMPRSGWQIHYNPKKTKGNPILLDLLVLANAGRYLELELKTETGAIRPEQKTLIDQGASLARSAEVACKIIKEWHDSL